MFFNKKFILKKIQVNNPLLEYTSGELKNASDPGRKSRSKDLLTHFSGIKQGPDGQARTIWKVPSQENRDISYDVTLAILVPGSTLFEIAKRKWDPSKFSSVLQKSDVKVHCTCPDFLFGGEKYNLGSGRFKGALEPKNTGYKGEQLLPTLPDVKDPGRNNILCKHAIAVCNRLAANSFNIMKQARDTAIVVKPNPELSDDQTPPLKKDIEFVDVDKERTDKIIQNLYRGAEANNGEKLEKNNTTEEENKELVNDITQTEPTTPTIEEVPGKPTEVKTNDLITDVTGQQMAGTPKTKTKETVETKKEIVDENTPVSPEKVDSNLNQIDEKIVLEKDTQDTPQDKEEIDSIIGNKAQETTELEKDKL